MWFILTFISGKPVHLLATCSEDTLVSIGSLGCILLSGSVYFYVQQALMLTNCIILFSRCIVFTNTAFVVEGRF